MDDVSPMLVNNLDVHVTNSCNLHCHGCNHLANYGYGGPFKVEELVDWIKPWKDRLYFKRISLLGGEPLLNPYLKDICITYRRLFSQKETKLRIITNGILITKCPWLKELIQEYHVHIQVSLHVFTGKTKNEKLINQVKEGMALLEKWAGNTVRPAESSWGPYVEAKQKLNFQVFYQGAGTQIKPFQHDDITESKKHCACKTLQLYKSNLYKCAPIAYIGDVLEKFGMENDPDWKPYLNYEPLTPDCSDDELVDFMKMQPHPEWTCKMCPPYANVILSDEREISQEGIES
jgi:organic radical activating enzyme